MSVGCAGFCFGFTGCLSVVNIVGFAWVVGLIVVLWGYDEYWFGVGVV